MFSKVLLLSHCEPRSTQRAQRKDIGFRTRIMKAIPFGTGPRYSFSTEPEAMEKTLGD